MYIYTLWRVLCWLCPRVETSFYNSEAKGKDPASFQVIVIHKPLWPTIKAIINHFYMLVVFVDLTNTEWILTVLVGGFFFFCFPLFLVLVWRIRAVSSTIMQQFLVEESAVSKLKGIASGLQWNRFWSSQCLDQWVISKIASLETIQTCMRRWAWTGDQPNLNVFF